VTRSGHPGWWPASGFEESAQPRTKSEAAYMRIRRRILDGRLAPGSSIDQEEIAAELGLSTTPVREALRRLESERLVVGRAHRDTIVAPLPMEVVENVYQVRQAMDPLAASLAATNASDRQRADMLAVLESGEPGIDDAAARVHYNRSVHRGIYSACGNEILVELLDSMWDVTDRYQRIAMLKTGKAIIDIDSSEHVRIIEAVVNRRSSDAANLMQSHVTGTLEKIRAAARMD
jgi:DNA-binding GntR family transcriptional regulator